MSKKTILTALFLTFIILASASCSAQTDHQAVSPFEVVRVVDICSNYSQSPRTISGDSQVVIFDGWLASSPQLVQDHIDAVILDITLDGQPLVLDTKTEIFPDYDNDGNLKGYSVFFEKNVGKLLRGTHRVDALVTWKRKLYDGLEYYGPGTPNESVSGYCEIIVR